MTDPDTRALQALADKVEAGEIALSDLDQFIPSFGMTTTANDAHMAYRGSNDAFFAMREEVLPEYGFVTITRLCDDWDADTERLSPSDWRVELDDGSRGDDSPEAGYASADNAILSRAGLLAILRALIAGGRDEA